MYTREMIPGYCQAIRNLKARLRRTKQRWSNEESFAKRRNLERVWDYLELEIEKLADELACIKRYV